MEPLSALAIAAAVFQFLDLGGKLCIKGWEKYKHIQQGVPTAQKLAGEEKELKQIFEELSGQISWFQQVSTRIKVSERPTPIQVHLSELSDRCTDLSRDFERIKNQMKLPSPQKIKPAKRKNRENEEVQRDQEDIERIIEQLEPLKREIMDFILLSLWDDSKHLTQWEWHFSKQLDKLIELLGGAEKITISNHPKSTLSSEKASVEDRTYEMKKPKDYMQEPVTATVTDEEMARLRNVLQPLIQPGKGSVPLRQLSEGIIERLKIDSGAMNPIRRELMNVLWKDDWKLDASMALAKIDTTAVAHAIATGIQFNNFQTREDAISETFMETYSWIFQNDPPKEKNMSTWASFPNWLKDDSNKVYWITGKPGSGKSTMMKLILRHAALRDMLSQSLGSLRLLLVKYYAWLAGTTMQKSLEGLKRTIISQALEQYPDLAPLLVPRRWAFCQVLRNTSGLPKWDAWEIEESFEILLSSCGETIKLVIFIDGLDEFDTPPFEVIKCIQHTVARCPNGLKICAASRPWPEFQDEFNEGPMLQMHLQTENDMNFFVNETFKTNKGFVEQREINPEAVSQLLTDIVQRANGVFLWVSIVVRHLSSGFSEGQSISEARKTLETLPTDISSLYDAIWAGIRPNNLPDASYMIQVLRAFGGPLPWLTLWLIEESRFTTIDKIVFPQSEKKTIAAQKSLKRKLAARTKCILEVNEGRESSFVDFIHRTARDWAIRPNMWQLICSKSNGEFDPYLYILKGEALDLSRHPPKTRNDLRLIKGLLRYASQVRDIPENESEFVNYLNLVDERFETIIHAYGHPKNIEPLQNEADENLHTFTKYYGKRFLELAAHFALLPYIKAAARSDPNGLSQMFSRGSLLLLEKAICGNHPNETNHSDEESISQAPWDQRLATVKYLIEQDVYKWREHIWNNRFRNLKKDVERYSRLYPENSEYYSKVVLYLDKKESELSVSSRIRSFF